MKKIFILLPLIANFAVADCYLNINTKKFNIRIQENCGEGYVSCNDVSYNAIRLSDGAKIDLKGKTINNPSTLNFYGYEFKNGNYTYLLYTDHTTPRLEVLHQGKKILEESIKIKSVCAK